MAETYSTIYKKVTRKKRQLNPAGIFILSNFPLDYVFLIAKYLFEPVSIYDLDKFFLWPMVKSLIGKTCGIIGIKILNQMLPDVGGTCWGFGFISGLVSTKHFFKVLFALIVWFWTAHS